VALEIAAKLPMMKPNIYKYLFRYFHSGQWAVENSGAWVWHPRMLALCWSFQVCDISQVFMNIYCTQSLAKEKMNYMTCNKLKYNAYISRICLHHFQMHFHQIIYLTAMPFDPCRFGCSGISTCWLSLNCQVFRTSQTIATHCGMWEIHLSEIYFNTPLVKKTRI
jgi:hypothetical protein